MREQYDSLEFTQEEYEDLELWRHNKTAEEKRRKQKELLRKIERKASMTFMITMIVMFVICVARLWVFDINRVSGISMYPTLNDNDLLFVQKYDTTSIGRYDIVTVNAEDTNGKEMRIIKRVYGLPGETIQIYTDGSVYIDGIRLPDAYQILTPDVTEEEKELVYQEVLDIGEYYVLGDNRAVSQDSRYYGAFDRDDIMGVVVCRLHPFESISDTSIILEN